MRGVRISGREEIHRLSFDLTDALNLLCVLQQERDF